MFTSFVAAIAIFALNAAGHYQQGHDLGHDHGHGGVGAVAVHYSVVTEHKTDYHGHGGESGGHASVHTWGHEGGDKAAAYKDHDDDGHYGGHDDDHDHHAYPKYEFSYGVKDPKTGDIKSHTETRDGGNVKGKLIYTLKEADGTTRHVEYSADKHKGFKAIVHTLGHAHQAAHNEGHGGHGYDHGHGKATSYVIVKKQEEEKKH
ncbi:probable zinc transporter protein DDB_G0282067 [Lucilia sericata]|uniref:probable zinc transporter protein DDB_G0282067 n=1 Tax=Lucilia sericata TaxID=13632 RepID=UPI0018A825E9|nr:probable zinc transporter protein DDB_G0282067 [Lucilia sericata]